VRGLEVEILTEPNNGRDPSVSLGASIGRSTLFGIVAAIVQVATRLVMVPVTITHLGLDGYGIWSIVLMLATYMQFGVVGTKSAFQKYVAEATGNGDYHKATKLLSTGSIAILGISLVGLIPVAIFSRGLASAAGVPPEYLQSSARAISMLALVMVFSNMNAPYEAIITGGHRIDLVRRFGVGLCVLEAAGIIGVLHLGYGIFAMASVMAASGSIYTFTCYVVSHRVVPQIRVGVKHVTRTVGRELIRFVGSYQLVSMLQLVHGAIAPIAILRAYGARPEGVLAVANRLVSPVQMCLYAFVVPVLSGSAMIYASGSAERMRTLLAKSFKATLYLTLLPLGLISAFGTYVIAAWVGQTDPQFQATLALLSLAMFFQSFALLGLVLYRASGRAVMDIVREGLRIVTILLVVLFARHLGFLGVLGGLATAEFVGMLFMMFAIRRTYCQFDMKALLREGLRLATATIGIVTVGVLATRVPIPFAASARAIAGLRMGAIAVATLLSSYPILYLTGAVTRGEVRTILEAFGKKTSISIPLES
jgi:O-antigen/teichoic acid export membrane protein